MKTHKVSESANFFFTGVGDKSLWYRSNAALECTRPSPLTFEFRPSLLMSENMILRKSKIRFSMLRKILFKDILRTLLTSFYV